MSSAAGAVIGIGGSVLGGLFGKKSSKKAAAAAQAAYNDARGTVSENSNLANKSLSDFYNTAEGNLSPYQGAGEFGIAGLLDPERFRNFGVEDFQVDPGYQFALEQGQRGIENSAAAGGRLISGATLKSLNRFNQGLANQQYQNSFDRFNQNRDYQMRSYGGLASMGQNAVNVLGQFGSDAATNAAQNYMNTGLNLAKLRVGQGGAMSNSILQQGQIGQNMIGNIFGSLGSFAGSGGTSAPQMANPYPNQGW